MRHRANSMLLSTRLLAGGIKSYLPIRKTYTGTGGSNSARYCYSAWLRHLVTIAGAVPELRPRVVAELGPGDSIGLGLAALLSGADRYVALDVLAHTNVGVNLPILDELVALFRDRADIPADDEFPELYPRIDAQRFPAKILNLLELRPDTSDQRVAALRHAIGRLEAGPSEDAEIRYLCPWPTAAVEPGSIDLIVTQAVLQDMGSLDRTGCLADRVQRDGALVEGRRGDVSPSQSGISGHRPVERALVVWGADLEAHPRSATVLRQSSASLRVSAVV